MLKGESVVNECSKALEVSDLLHFLALLAEELISGDRTCVACTPVASQTQLLGLADIQVHKAAIKPGEKAVDELTVLSVFCRQATKTMSSAYSIRERSLLLHCTSFVYMENSRGESTHPWGTPVFRTRQSERMLLIRLHCGHSLRNSLIQSTTLLLVFNTVQPHLLLKRLIDLKAEEKSMKRKQTCMLALSRWVDILFRRVSVASSTPCLDWYVNCMGSMNSVVWLESSLCYMLHRFAEQRCESNGPVIRVFCPQRFFEQE